MRYGFCTGFATTPLFSIDSSLEAAVSSWGFDYIEYPLMSLAALPEDTFLELRQRAATAHVACDCMCNLFPASVPVIGNTVSEKQIREYLDTAFERAALLGTKKIIFGSAGARKRGELPKKEADRQFVACLRILEEYCASSQIMVLLEAIRYGEADYINTLAEGAEMVRRAREESCAHIALMADLFHMSSNREDPSDLDRYFALIRHIHICEQDRKLPDNRFSTDLLNAIAVLQDRNYNGTVSYESVLPKNDTEGKSACTLLRNTLP
ncbi:MAG: sugar phosphate isomerase/epimerase [Oscillospiraceae bacterium]|nr:sugar phosphate isomerase/epimerase [Oscillospiraceae bacterium]